MSQLIVGEPPLPTRHQRLLFTPYGRHIVYLPTRSGKRSLHDNADNITRHSGAIISCGVSHEQIAVNMAVAGSI